MLQIYLGDIAVDLSKLEKMREREPSRVPWQGVSTHGRGNGKYPEEEEEYLPASGELGPEVSPDILPSSDRSITRNS